jgi:serine kinase of HPr protein (carbohydrate metabolism regulator)
MKRVTPMAAPRISAETAHGNTVAKDGRAVIITGPSGSGKSDLTLRLLDRGFTLISDDRTVLKRDGDRIIASAPPTIAGKLEIRGIGIVEMDHADNLPVALIVELTSDIQRMPEDSQERSILAVKLPFVTIDAMAASAPAKVAVALDRLGLNF